MNQHQQEIAEFLAKEFTDVLESDQAWQAAKENRNIILVSPELKKFSDFLSETLDLMMQARTRAIVAAIAKTIDRFNRMD